ncbi:hypothetical protein ACMFMF_002141 [Clarireedia jacksonii]
MHFTKAIALGATLCASTINAHLALTWPLPFRAAYNPNSVQSQIDYSITSPLAASGSNFPCKYNDMGTAGGKSVVTWQAGATANWTVGSGALHGGGSCQVALSYDSGKTFHVIHSYIGSCPTAVSSSADFTIPADAPAGEALFAWTWQNLVGNREFYMSCASVTIEGGEKARAAPAVAFSERPGLFLVNLGNGCTSVEGKSVNYPAPGPDADVTRVSSDQGSFTGTCGPVNGVVSANGAGSASASTVNSSSAAPMASSASAPIASSSSGPVSIEIIPSASVSSSAVQSASAPTSSASAPVSSAPAPASSASAPASSASSASTPSSSGTSSSSSSSSPLTISTDGQCSGGKTCKGSTWGPCCSKWGFCGGPGDAWCGAGCQPGFGDCGTFINSTSASASSPLKGAGKPIATTLATFSTAAAASESKASVMTQVSVSVTMIAPSFQPTLTATATEGMDETPTMQDSVVVVTETAYVTARMIRGRRWW